MGEMVLLKALTNLPHSDFSLCKSLLSIDVLEGVTSIKTITYLADLLETCMFKEFWAKLRSPGIPDLVRPIAGFEDSIKVRLPCCWDHLSTNSRRNIMSTARVS